MSKNIIKNYLKTLTKLTNVIYFTKFTNLITRQRQTERDREREREEEEESQGRCKLGISNSNKISPRSCMRTAIDQEACVGMKSALHHENNLT